jgi:hypothetical protein
VIIHAARNDVRFRVAHLLPYDSNHRATCGRFKRLS